MALVDRKHGPMPSLLTVGASFGLLVVFVVPSNYVYLSNESTVLSNVCIFLSLFLCVFIGMKTNGRAVLCFVLCLLPPLIVTMVSGDSLVPVVMFVVPAVAAFALGCAASVRGTLFGLCVVGLLLVIGLCLDFIHNGSFVSNLFGVPMRELIDLSAFRARGFVGQPVPAAMAGATIGIVGLFLSGSLRATRNRVAARAFFSLTVVVTLLLTGTRSALLVSMLGLALTALLLARHKKSRPYRPWALAGWFLALVVLTVSFEKIMEWFSQTRLFAFSSLMGTDSVDARQYALVLLSRWSDSADPVPKLAGNGLRNLQSQLIDSFGILGLSTVDNMYMTSLWDFGVLALIGGLSFLACAAFFAIKHGPTALNQAGLIGVLLFLASGFFYDAMYSRPVWIMAALFLGLTVVRTKAGYAPVADPFIAERSRSDGNH